MRICKKKIVLSLAVLAALVSWSSAAQAQEQGCFQSIVADAIPTEAGDIEKMAQWLEPTIASPQFVESIADRRRLKLAMRALEATGLRPEKTECRFDGKVRNSDKRRDRQDEIECTHRSRRAAESLDLDLAQGKVKYMNADRSYDGASGIDSQITASQAIGKVSDVLGQVGVPAAEVSGFTSTLLKAAAVPIVQGVPDPSRAEVRVAEVHVIGRRSVDQLPVYDSIVRAAVGADGRIARMKIQWPNFCVTPGLVDDLTKMVMSRAEVLDAMAKTLERDNGCDTLSGLRAEIMYVPAQTHMESALTEIGSAGDEDQSTNTIDEECYVPAIVMQATPLEPEEDSGQISMGAPEYVVSLFKDTGERG